MANSYYTEVSNAGYLAVQLHADVAFAVRRESETAVLASTDKVTETVDREQQRWVREKENGKASVFQRPTNGRED